MRRKLFLFLVITMMATINVIAQTLNVKGVVVD